MITFLSTHIQPLWEWLLRATLQASLLIYLILLIQVALGKRLGARWRYCLWLVLFVRMAMPWAPQSQISVFNLLPQSLPFDHEASMVGESSDTSGTSTIVTSGAEKHREGETALAGHTTEGTEIIDGRMSQAAPMPQEKASFGFPRIVDILPLLWLAGVCVLSGYILLSNILLWRTLRSERPLTGQRILDLLEDCKEQIGTRVILGVIATEKVGAPALFGFVRPRLLLPKVMMEELTLSELRYIFLHELAHLRRHDIFVGYVASLLHVLHWFNPIVWFGFRRVRADRELATDALAMSSLKVDEAPHYGHAIVHQLERFLRPRRLPSLAGLSEDKAQIKRRMTMIAEFQKNSYRWSPLASVLIVILACISLPDAERTKAAETVASKPAHTPSLRKLRIPSGIPYDAQLSPDGKSIAVGGLFDGKLWIMPRVGPLGPDYPGVPQLLDAGGLKVDPYGFCWSADGQWIAFNNWQEGDYRMCVVPAQGGTPKEVYRPSRGGPAPNRQMSLSPNGKTLAFSSLDANSLYVYTISVEGDSPKRLVETPAREPVFSPDGKMIAYVQGKNVGDGGGSLWVVSSSGGTPRRIAEADAARSPVWSPDGRMIAFFDGNMGGQIYLVPVDEHSGQAAGKITITYPKETGGLYRLTGWTPDNKIGAIFASPAEGGLYVFTLKTGKAVQVTRGGMQPHWFADGKRIIYSTGVGEKEAATGWSAYATAWVPAEGGQTTTIPIQADANIVKAGWGAGNNVSPDDKAIVFAGRKAGEGKGAMHIWTLPIGGGKPNQLTNASAPMADQFPCWSPDGKSIAFVRSRNSQDIGKRFTEADIFIIPAAGGEPRQLTTESDKVSFGSIAWSPDGRLLAYLSGDVRVIPAEGGQSRAITKLPRGFEVNVELAWSPDSRRIAFNDYPGTDGGGIKIVSLDDGQIVDVKTGMTATRLYHLDWSRDGEKLVFAGQQGGVPEFWLIENFLPEDIGK